MCGSSLLRVHDRMHVLIHNLFLKVTGFPMSDTGRAGGSTGSELVDVGGASGEMSLETKETLFSFQEGSCQISVLPIQSRKGLQRRRSAAGQSGEDRTATPGTVLILRYDQAAQHIETRSMSLVSYLY